MSFLIDRLSNSLRECATCFPLRWRSAASAHWLATLGAYVKRNGRLRWGPGSGRRPERQRAAHNAGRGATLIILLAAIGLTILRIHSLLSVHLFVGMLLIPPVLLKMASTGYRFVRYYMGNFRYRKKGHLSRCFA